MTQIDFYLLGEDAGDNKELAACKLTHKAYHLGHRIYILTADASESERLDRLLWTFSAGSFIPHQVRSDTAAPTTPVVIGHEAPSMGSEDVLISLTREVPEGIDRFARVAEIVSPAPEDKERARERFRLYRERGYALQTHHL